MSEENNAQLLEKIDTQRNQVDELTSGYSSLQNSIEVLKRENEKLKKKLAFAQRKALQQTKGKNILSYTLEVLQQHNEETKNEDILVEEQQKSLQVESQKRLVFYVKINQQFQDDQDMEDLSQDVQDTTSIMQQKMVNAQFAYYSDSPLSLDQPVYIQGEFNKWKPALMERLANQIFYYDTKLLSGYRYRFNFKVDDKITTDCHQNSEQDQDNQDVNFNYILSTSAYNQNEESKIDPQILQKLPIFVHPDLISKREEELKQFQLNVAQLQDDTSQAVNEALQDYSKESENQKIEILSLFLKRNRFVLSKLILLRKIRKHGQALSNDDIVQSSSEQITIFDEENQRITKAIKYLIRGKIAKSLEHSLYYYINSYRSDTNELVLIRVYDNNGILLIDNQASEKNIINASESIFFESYQILFKEEELKFRHDLIHNKDHTLRLRYDVKMIPLEEFYTLECIPLETQPQLPLDSYQYQLEVYNGRVQTALGDQGKIKFEAYRDNFNYDSGNSRWAFIYTNEIQGNILNIFHIHLNEITENVSFEAHYLNENQIIDDFTDFTGSSANYRILVKNQRIHGLLFNCGSNNNGQVNFVEYRLNPGSLANVDYSNTLQYSTENMLVKVVNVPIGILAIPASNDIVQYPQSQLQHNSYGFCSERCLNQSLGRFLDVKVISVDNDETLLDNEENIAIPPCLMNDAMYDKKERYIALLKLDQWTPIELEKNF
ncbi:UNKNOWN [Stylonychia lemnae]|uniref:AMP-activated protein kinase glycogen-binding domain-containing protein n=1 Tax=Stylonychia lemnae TaxID=5949 RepID=A0A078A6U3_STYLE|nr:UNKNOWN [Stylonychia lemnae]|eukprot:CDW77292.1 UNKNOWN [Stylonychia lemnae]